MNLAVDGMIVMIGLFSRSITTIANNLTRNNSWDTANRSNGTSMHGMKLASRKGSADSRHSDPSQARTSQTRIIE